MIQFQQQGHSYTSIEPDGIQWIGITTLVGALKEPFDSVEKARKSSTRKPTEKYPNKWYGVHQQDILDAWAGENRRSTDLGYWYHNKLEQELLSKGQVDGLQVYPPVMNGDIKLAPDQRLQEGVYPEHMVYLKSAGICGQSDIVEVRNKVVDITDHKTSKEISREGWANWEGIRKKMLTPVQHVEDCHFNHYSLQLSLYMYCILMHNPSYIPGRLTINHVKFETDGEDKYGYPITRLENGEPIVKSIEPISLPYMKTEVQQVVKWIKEPENRNKVINSKKQVL